MAPTPPESATGMGRTERMVLAAVAALLAVLLLWLRGGLHPEAPLERLARQSLDLPVALADGRPTLVEFYADWCEACRAMAPAMDALEQQHRGALDVVLLNVDNPRWEAELERYEVNGIPQLELFDAAGSPVGRAIGARRPGELQALVEALITAEPLPALAGVGATSALTASDSAAVDPAAPLAGGASRSLPATMAGPRSHG
ncbi:MAG: thioredoxin domain-containing protein [Cyanobium sp.]